MKILSIGNSFSQDTMTLLPEIVKSMGIDGEFAYLYIGGCPIAHHYLNAVDNLPIYHYYTYRENGWYDKKNVSITEAVLSQKWDWINIQHGSKDGHRYTEDIFYKRLPELVGLLKNIAGDNTRISFNMTWVADPEKEHHEMVLLYGNDQEKMYSAVVEITRRIVASTVGIDKISPTGIAIQKARKMGLDGITRDGYHLSYGLGRYIAALTFLKALTGVAIQKAEWAPSDVDGSLMSAAKQCALQAVEEWETQN